MPNLDTHAGLAMHAFPEGGVVFAAGEVFDDAVRMAGGVPRRDGPPSMFALGIRSNNSVTDPAFDNQPALRVAQAAMTADLTAAGIPERLHRTCTGPGSDILYSGVTLQHPFVARAYLEVCDFLLSAEGRALVMQNTAPSKRAPVPVPEVAEHVARIARSGLNTAYSDPAYVVERLRARAATRPRLAFPDDSGLDQDLSAVFAAQQVRLAQASEEIYAGTIARITAEPLPDAERRTAAPVLPVVPHVSSLVERVSAPAAVGGIASWNEIVARELTQLSGSGEQRQRLFVASRAAGHFLLQHAARYMEEHTISRQGEAAPAFPEGWVGSISHSGDAAAAAIANRHDYRSVGIDLECKPRRLDRDRPLTERERALPELERLDVRTIYTIKEAVFKAVHPLVRGQHPKKFWYQDAEIATIDEATQTASVRMADTPRGNRIAGLLGDSAITCYYLEKPAYASAVCTVQ